MSFADKNKAWLLPLLALGIGGVVYLNYQTFTGTPKPTAPGPAGNSATEAAPAATSAPAAPVAASANPPASSSAPEGPSSNVWADLKAMAIVPDPLGQDAALREMARASLESESSIVYGPVPRPSWTRDPKPQPKEGEVHSSVPAPDVDFLILTPSGSRAWFEGRGYHSGESLDGKPFTVGPIAPSSVDLKGPGGRVRRWTNPVHGPQAPHPPEAP